MRGAIPIRRLQSVVDEPLAGERETCGADGGPRDGAAQPFEFVALIGQWARLGSEPVWDEASALRPTSTPRGVDGPHRAS